jgi:hypothetical protein
MDSLTATVKATISYSAGKNRDLGTLTWAPNFTKSVAFAFGTAANQADQVFDDDRTLSASASEDIDLAGSLTNAFGETITLARVKMIYIENKSAVDTLVVGGATSNALANLFGNVNDVINIKPGGFFLIAAPLATAYPVTAGTGDLLHVVNGAGGSTTYRLVIIGATA